jgi:hypothetical protein
MRLKKAQEARYGEIEQPHLVRDLVSLGRAFACACVDDSKQLVHLRTEKQTYEQTNKTDSTYPTRERDAFPFH